MNLHSQSLPILFIWPNDATCAISGKSENPTSFARAAVLDDLPLHPRAHLFEFTHTIASSIIYLANDVTGVILRYSETPTYFARTLSLVNLPLLPGATLFEFSHAIASNISYLA